MLNNPNNLPTSGTVSGSAFPDMLAAIQQVCLSDKHLLDQHVRTVWVDVLDGLVAVERASGVSDPGSGDLQLRHHLNLWTLSGVGMGLKGEELRRERALERSAEMGGLVGCSWLRCPVFEAITQREVMRCPQCQKVHVPSDLSIRSGPYAIFSGPVLRESLPTAVGHRC